MHALLRITQRHYLKIAEVFDASMCTNQYILYSANSQIQCIQLFQLPSVSARIMRQAVRYCPCPMSNGFCDEQ